MSIIVNHNPDILSQYTAWVAKNKMNPDVKTPEPIYLRKGNLLHLPFAKGMTNVFGNGLVNSRGVQIVHPTSFSIQHATSDETRRIKQDEMKTSIANHVDATKSCIVACPPGFGKTRMTLDLLAQWHGHTRFASVIVTCRTVVKNQWLAAFKEFSPPPIVHILKVSDTLDGIQADIVMASIQTLSKWPYSMSANLLIADEIHQLTSAKQSLGLLKISPQFLLGLSATPYRTDDLKCVIEWLFGSNKVAPAVNVTQKHFVYKINTGLRYELEFSTQGMKKTINWSALMDRQANDHTRTQYIVDLMDNPQFSHIQWLVVVKRNVHIDQFVGFCFTKNISVSSLGMGKNDYDPKARVIVGTVGKVGTGFNEPSRTGLVIAADTLNYYPQLLGRIFRNPETRTVPIVLDIVDDLTVLQRHYATRAQDYIRQGGIITEISAQHSM